MELAVENKKRVRKIAYSKIPVSLRLENKKKASKNVKKFKLVVSSAKKISSLALKAVANPFYV